MKKIMMFLIMTNWLANGELKSNTYDEIVIFKNEVDNIDRNNRGKLSDDEVIKKWWDLADNLVLTILNDTTDKAGISNYIPSETLELEDDLSLYQPKQGGIGIRYKYCCGPHCAPQRFYIEIIPLNEVGSIYYVAYSRSWSFDEKCDNLPDGAGTFRIIGKSEKRKNFEITARFEQTNFYREMVLTGKLNDMVIVDRNNFGWSGALETQFDPIVNRNDEIRFHTKLKVHDPSSPSFRRLYLYWVYDKNKKLRCLYYLNDYELEKDPQTGKLRPMGKKVELAP